MMTMMEVFIQQTHPGMKLLLTCPTAHDLFLLDKDLVRSLLQHHHHDRHHHRRDIPMKFLYLLVKLSTMRSRRIEKKEVRNSIPLVVAGR